MTSVGSTSCLDKKVALIAGVSRCVGSDFAVHPVNPESLLCVRSVDLTDEHSVIVELVKPKECGSDRKREQSVKACIAVAVTQGLASRKERLWNGRIALADRARGAQRASRLPADGIGES